ncbi:hypothetical protein ABZZ79_05880 [Streptomyces sp. NPDC006458]|uniref:hypothetical protein n=1 Tax=Streptomyces sp. NPDC006458 TaxID=3154302 RepID=UPI0033BB79FF
MPAPEETMSEQRRAASCARGDGRAPAETFAHRSPEPRELALAARPSAQEVPRPLARGIVRARRQRAQPDQGGRPPLLEPAERHSAAIAKSRPVPAAEPTAGPRAPAGVEADHG